MAERPTPVARPEYVRDEVREQDIGVVLKPLTAWERVYGNGWFRKGLILAVLAAIWQAYAHVSEQRADPADLRRDGGVVPRARGYRRAARQGLGLDQGAAAGLRDRPGARPGVHHRGDHHAHRQRPAGDAHRDAQSAAGDRAAAAGADLAGTRQPEHRVRAGARGDVADRAQHALGLPGACRRRCAWSAATTASPACATWCRS